MSEADPPRPPARLAALTQWQAGKVATIGARLTAGRMPLGGRADFAVLAALTEFGSSSQADLGRYLGLDRNDINGVVTRLDQAGAIDRQPDPADRRRNVVSITPSGTRHLAELQAVADEVQNQLLAGLDAGERIQLRTLLGKILDSHGPQSS